MSKKGYCTFIICVPMLFIFSGVQAAGPFSFTQLIKLHGNSTPEYSSNFTRDANAYQVSFFGQLVKWDEAEVTCKVYHGYLLSKLPTTSALYSTLKKMGVGYLWAGVRRRQNYYIQDGMTYQVLYKAHKGEKYSKIIGEQWADEEDLSYDCVVLDLKNGVLKTANCSSLFPFVCESEQILEADNKGCPDKWYVAPALSLTGRNCISEVQPALHYRAAEMACAGKISRLVTANEYALLKARKQLYSNESNNGG